jgi:hypothetical protein
MKNSVTPLDESNPWWIQFEKATKSWFGNARRVIET